METTAARDRENSGKNQGHKRIMPLRYSILLTILALLVPLVLAMSLAQYQAIKKDMERTRELMAELSEAGLITGLRTAQNGYNLLQKALERDLTPAFAAFARAYDAARGDLNELGLAKLKASLGAELDLYVINAASGVIEATTLEQDLGLDLSQFSDFWNNLKPLLVPGEVISGPISQESRSGALRYYSYLLLPDKKHILEIGAEANEFKALAQRMERIAVVMDWERLNPGLERVRVFERHGYLNKNPGEGRAEEPALSRILQSIEEKRSLEYHDEKTGKTTRYVFIDVTGADGWPIYKVAELTFKGAPVDELLGGVLRTQLTIGAVFLVLGVLFSLLASSRISGPVKDIIADVDRIAGGDFEHSVSVKSRNELRILEQSIQVMLQRIRDQMAALRRAEGEILERNSELENSNQEFVREMKARKSVELQLRKNETTLRAVLDAITESTIMVDPDGTVVEVNEVSCRRLGRRREELVGANMYHFLDWELFERRLKEGQEVICSKTPLRFEDEAMGRVLDIVCAPVEGPSGEVEHLAFYVSDITERRRADKELSEHMAHFQQLFENSPLAIAIYNVDNTIRKVNKAYERLFGYSERELRSESPHDLIVPVNRLAEADYLTRRQTLNESATLETMRKRKDGNLVHVSILSFPIVINGEREGSYLIYQDISERKRVEEKLLHQSFHDELTGFPNRAQLLDRLRQVLQRTKEKAFPIFALLYLDLDRFKMVNDSLGHQAGDQLLFAISRKLQKMVRNSDTVSRIGGDEFAVLLAELDSPRQAMVTASRIQEDIAQPMDIGGQNVVATTSIGIVVGPAPHDRPEFILRDAEIAMYRAKGMGRNRIRLFQSTMREQAAEVLRLENDLRRAVEEREFEVYYQPIVSMRTGVVEGFEALLRWKHPTRGLIYPDEFIPVAEESALIIPIGILALEEACAQVRDWQVRYTQHAALGISVNLSAKQFLQGDLIEQIGQTVRTAELELESLKLEITESVVMENAQSARIMLHRLKSLNVRLGIDDFGTGYSSLAYLQQFPIDTLKIDRSFVMRMEEREADVEIVRAIVALAHNLGKDVVAEGVETVEQAQELAKMGCDFFQGYYFSRPVPAAEAEEILRTASYSW